MLANVKQVMDKLYMSHSYSSYLQTLCYFYSLESSHRDDFSEYPYQMIWLKIKDKLFKKLNSAPLILTFAFKMQIKGYKMF